MRNLSRNSYKKLYCNQAGRYITLTDVRNIILGGEQIKVTDKFTQKDVTHEILKGVLHKHAKFEADQLYALIRSEAIGEDYENQY